MCAWDWCLIYHPERNDRYPGQTPPPGGDGNDHTRREGLDPPNMVVLASADYGDRSEPPAPTCPNPPKRH
eukprot:7121171-Pyramimonas_sp.AAC.1